MDRAVLGLVLGLLPILFLPEAGLKLAPWCLAGLALICLSLRKWLWMASCLLAAFAYLQVGLSLDEAKSIPQGRQNGLLTITRILKQEGYQTAIGQDEQGRQIYLNWQSDTPLKLHQTYKAELNLRPVSGRLNMGNFDRQKWYFANHIQAISTVKRAEMLASEAKPLRTQWLESVRGQTQGLPSQGLLLALAFGERAWLKATDWQLFQHTATAHLIAISGLHIALAFGFGFWLAKSVQWLLLRFQLLQAVGFSLFFTRIAGLALALGYSYLAGFALPTQRALMAICFLLLVQFLRRYYTPFQLWWRVVALLLVLDPLALLSDSFWLSILAVLSLIIWYRYFPLKHFCKISAQFPRLLASLVHLQVGILLVFAPVQFFFFEGSSPLAFVANLIIVPLYSFLLVPLVLLSLLTHNFLGSWQVADWLAQLSLGLLEPLSHHWWELSLYWQWQLLSLNLLTLLGLYYWINRKPAWPYLLILPLGFNLTFYLYERFQPQTQWISFDVGQGLAIGLRYGDKIVLFDTGASWGDNSMAKLEILPYLARKGLEVEAIFLSHDDNDHAGGVAHLLEKYPQARLISAGNIPYANKPPESCQAGLHWTFGPFQLKALYPQSQQLRAKNQDSCTLLADIHGYKILLTGDLGLEQERQIAHKIGKIDFLQVPHHGSKTSTSETLLNATQPHTAIISTGRFNPWRMPNQTVVKRLEKHKILQMNTARTGMVEVNFEPNGWEIRTARGKWGAWYGQFIE
ncbi:DNA internalization-related competence protein ComEC/Rec2 [Pasteurellaceae bacterium RH1A]|nr:DNA internalization-related competence protein ComEC/Rec2 [Pasteurellaceae bacterium RH1A]